MKLFLKIAVFIFSFFWMDFSFAQKLFEFEIAENPGNLNSYYYSPNNLDSTKTYPLVVVLHGCSQNANQMFEQTGWKELADSNQFHLVFPEQKRINNPNNCFTWYQDSDIERGKGEVESIYQMILKVQDRLNIDSTRIFVYGLSAGAAMSLAVMSCYPEKINAGAVLAGGPYKSVSNPFKAISAMKNPESLSAEERGKKVKEQNPNYTGKYPRLILLHGEKDKIVSPLNSFEIMIQWSYAMDLDSNAVLTSINNHEGIKGLTRTEVKNKEGNAAIIYYTLEGLGHALAIDPGKGEKQGGKTGIFSKDVDLFSTWYIANDFGLLKD